MNRNEEKKLSNQALKYTVGQSGRRKRTTPKEKEKTRKDSAQPKKKEMKGEADNQAIHLAMKNNECHATAKAISTKRKELERMRRSPPKTREKGPKGTLTHQQGNTNATRRGTNRRRKLGKDRKTYETVE